MTDSHAQASVTEELARVDALSEPDAGVNSVVRREYQLGSIRGILCQLRVEARKSSIGVAFAAVGDHRAPGRLQPPTERPRLILVISNSPPFALLHWPY